MPSSIFHNFCKYLFFLIHHRGFQELWAIGTQAPQVQGHDFTRATYRLKENIEAKKTALQYQAEKDIQPVCFFQNKQT